MDLLTDKSFYKNYFAVIPGKITLEFHQLLQPLSIGK